MINPTDGTGRKRIRLMFAFVSAFVSGCLDDGITAMPCDGECVAGSCISPQEFSSWVPQPPSVAHVNHLDHVRCGEVDVGSFACDDGREITEVGSGALREVTVVLDDPSESAEYVFTFDTEERVAMLRARAVSKETGRTVDTRWTYERFGDGAIALEEVIVTRPDEGDGVGFTDGAMYRERRTRTWDIDGRMVEDVLLGGLDDKVVQHTVHSWNQGNYLGSVMTIDQLAGGYDRQHLQGCPEVEEAIFECNMSINYNGEAITSFTSQAGTTVVSESCCSGCTPLEG